SEMGVGESVRCAVRAAKAAGLPVSVKSVDRVEGPYRLLDLSLAGDREFPYAFNIFHVNADQSPIALAELGDNFTRRKYNIGYWAWQLEEFPARWQSSVSSSGRFGPRVPFAPKRLHAPRRCACRTRSS